MESHTLGTREEWLAARLELLDAEKELTRRSDELARRRRALPWVKLEEDYRFATEDGEASLRDLFGGRSQMLVYHFMFDPDWDEGCPSCSAVTDGFAGSVPHFEHHDVAFLVVSRALLDKLAAYKRRMGWNFQWVSSFGNSFNYDFHATIDPAVARVSTTTRTRRLEAENVAWSDWTGEQPGMSAFAREGDDVTHTYSAYAVASTRCGRCGSGSTHAAGPQRRRTVMVPSARRVSHADPIGRIGAGARTVAAVEVFIDPGGQRGLAEQVYVQVRDAIMEGRVVAGDVLTPSRTLATQLGISRFTVAEAYARLAAEGYVDGRRRGGTVVTSAVAAMPQGRPRAAIKPQALAASLTRYGRDPSATPRFDLRPGTVDSSLFPLHAWRHPRRRRSSAAPPHYGDPVGDDDLRAALAHWIGRTRGRDLGRRGRGDLGRVARHGPRHARARRAGRRRGCRGARLPTRGRAPPLARADGRRCPRRRPWTGRRRDPVPGAPGVHDAVASVPARRGAVPRTASAVAALGGASRRHDRGGRLRQPVPLRVTAPRAAAAARPGRRASSTSARSPRSCPIAAGRLRRRPAQHHPGGRRVAPSGRLVSAVADPDDAHPLDRRRSPRSAHRPEPPASPTPGGRRSCAACAPGRCRCGSCHLSAGLHVTMLVDGIDDDRALHEAFTADDLLVGSLPRCYRFSSAPAACSSASERSRGDAIAEAIDALERVLLRIVTADHRIDAS